MKDDPYIRKCAIALSELHGKQTIDAMTDFLAGRGLLEIPETVQRQWQKAKTRNVLGQVRKYDHPEGVGKCEWVSLYEEDDDGVRQMYFKQIGETSVEEAIQDCGYEFKMGMRHIRNLHEKVAKYKALHGQSFQSLLPFAVPRLPKLRRSPFS